MPYDKMRVNKSYLGDKEALGSRPLTDKKVYFFVSCDHSIYKSDLFFHNYIDRKDRSSLIVDKIAKVFEKNRELLSYSDIPIEQVNENGGLIRVNDRLKSILREYGYTDNSDLLKCSAKAELFHKIKNDTLRFIVAYINDEWNIILIDPWHLFATEKYEEYFNKFKKMAKYDMSLLKVK